MKVAFTSTDGLTIDQHFGTTRDFWIWEIGPGTAEQVGKVSALAARGARQEGPNEGAGFAAAPDLAPQGAPNKEGGFAAVSDLDEEDRIAARASAIAGCAIVYTVQIGGPAAARLVARRIHPMKTGIAAPIAEVVARLQEVLKGNPPPWLRKAMSGGAATAALDEERRPITREE